MKYTQIIITVVLVFIMPDGLAARHKACSQFVIIMPEGLPGTISVQPSFCMSASSYMDLKLMAR